ncbi:MAG: PAS domain S-box protein [Alkalispirochaetaceae bacterium]
MAQTGTGTDSKTILLVEDEAIIALATKTTLESWGYSVVLSYAGETAVSKAVAAPEIDLVLMDIDLGAGIDGTEAAQRILAARNVPIVFVSSHTERSLLEKVRGITRYGYVVKNSGDFVLRASIEMAFELFDAHQREQAHADRYRAVINSLPDLMFVLSGEGTFQEAYAPPTHSTAVPIAEERLRVFFDAARDNIMIHEVGADGLPGPYIDVNRSTCETLGYTREELLSMSPLDTSVDLNEEEIRRILGSLQEGESVLFEATGRRKDGATIPFELNLFRLTLQGRDTVVAVSRDVSARKRQDKMQRQITELAPAGIFVFDQSEGRLVFANSEYEKRS